MSDALRRFLQLESAGGICLFLAAAAAVLAANSPAVAVYDSLLGLPMSVRIGAFAIDKPLLLWINDGLMAVFFLLVGLELKREIVAGELSRPSQVALPGAAAIGGMAAPAAIYAAFNFGDPATLRGWAIPSATDIAFALGVLALLGPRVPVGAKLFLTAVAVFDDLGAIIIIALFYGEQLAGPPLLLAGAAVAVLVLLNLLRVGRIAAYMVVGCLLWVCVLKSGVHATLAGVITGLAVPIGARDEATPLASLEHALHPWVAFLILPVFAFANAGVSFAGIGGDALLHPVTLGIATGLLAGKAVGVFGAAWLLIRTGLARVPEGADLPVLFGVALLCGIGFTMSLFIGTLAFPDPGYAAPLRLGVIGGSLLAACLGLGWLAWALRAHSPAPQA